MVVSHTLDGKIIPAEHLLFARRYGQIRTFAATNFNHPDQLWAARYGDTTVFYPPSPRIPFLRQRFLGVR